MKKILFAAMAVVLMLTAGAVYVANQSRGRVLEADLAHNHFRAKMVAHWTSHSEADRVVTDFTTSDFSLTLKSGCGLEDGSYTKCKSLGANSARVEQDPVCRPPERNRCWAGLGTLVIETEPGFVDDPSTGQKRGARTLYFAGHYCCSYETPWVWLAPDGAATAILESDFVPLYGTYIVTWYPYHTEWKKSPWGDTFTWGGAGEPQIHRIKVVPEKE